jgi:hypothetical protein
MVVERQFNDFEVDSTAGSIQLPRYTAKTSQSSRSHERGEFPPIGELPDRNANGVRSAHRGSETTCGLVPPLDEPTLQKLRRGLGDGTISANRDRRFLCSDRPATARHLELSRSSRRLRVNRDLELRHQVTVRGSS